MLLKPRPMWHWLLRKNLHLVTIHLQLRLRFRKTEVAGSILQHKYTTTQSFLYNRTAFTFDLKNPPMYINYSFIPQNITEKLLKKNYWKKSGNWMYRIKTRSNISIFHVWPSVVFYHNCAKQNYRWDLFSGWIWYRLYNISWPNIKSTEFRRSPDRNEG